MNRHRFKKFVKFVKFVILKQSRQIQKQETLPCEKL